MRLLLRSAALCLVSPFTLAASGASGAPTSPSPPKAAPAGPGCSRGERGGLEEIACEVARGLGPLPSPAAIVAKLPVSDRVPTRGADLSLRIAQSIAGAMGRGDRPPATASSLSEAFGRTAKKDALVFVVPEISNGELRVAADAYRTRPSFWERLVRSGPSSVAHVFAARRLDAEISSFLAAVPLISTRVDRASHAMSDVVALACGDVDLDGSLELIVVGRRKISLGRVRAGSFHADAEARWKDLSPIAASPLRDPIGAAAILPGRHIDVGITDRASGFRLSPSLAPEATLDLPIPFASGTCLARSAAMLGAAGPCMRADAPKMDLSAVALADAVTGGMVVDRQGRARALAAWRTTDGTVTVEGGSGVLRIPNVGAALALGDLDLDGTPDLAASTNTLTAAEDALVVRSLHSDGPPRERLRLPVPQGIRAIAACPAEGSGLAPLVVATARELWIVR